MSILNLQASFFAVENPLRLLERLLYRHRYQCRIRLGGREVRVCWTSRAARALQKRDRPLIVELQLYFSCVVKKRVVFHDRVDFDTTAVDDRLELAFRPIASAVCDPCEFAARYPSGRDLSNGAAARMLPRVVEIDFRQGDWTGQFLFRDTCN